MLSSDGFSSRTRADLLQDIRDKAVALLPRPRRESLEVLGGGFSPFCSFILSEFQLRCNLSFAFGGPGLVESRWAGFSPPALLALRRRSELMLYLPFLNWDALFSCAEAVQCKETSSRTRSSLQRKAYLLSPHYRILFCFLVDFFRLKFPSFLSPLPDFAYLLLDVSLFAIRSPPMSFLFL